MVTAGTSGTIILFWSIFRDKAPQLICGATFCSNSNERNPTHSLETSRRTSVIPACVAFLWGTYGSVVEVCCRPWGFGDGNDSARKWTVQALKARDYRISFGLLRTSKDRERGADAPDSVHGRTQDAAVWDQGSPHQ